VHLTLRARTGVRSLRHRTVFPGVRAAIAASVKAGFRVVEYSVQSDHVHFIVEASDKRSLSGGVRGLAIRIALAINRALERQGPVWAVRYHTRPLRSPREVRNALVYVLMNFRKHQPADARHLTLDPCSSAPWFRGFRSRNGHARPPDRSDTPATTTPRTWRAAIGWRKHGLIDPREKPTPNPVA
jgi:REP element-mobilizing transposase RayT